ncbi:hypothetical protein Tco_1310727 [Tanacetum coccineum]
MTEQQVLNPVVEMMLVIVVEEQVLGKIGDKPLVFDEQLLVDMIDDERVLHKTVVVEEVNRIVEQLVNAIDDTETDDGCSMEEMDINKKTENQANPLREFSPRNSTRVIRYEGIFLQPHRKNLFADEKEREKRELCLLMAVPTRFISDVFHGMDDAKMIWAAIKTQRLVGNALTSKKMQKADIQKTSSSSLASDNVAFLSQAKASSSKHKPSQSSGSYSSYTTSSSKATPTATPGLADEVIHSFLATNADDVDLIHEDLDQIGTWDLENEMGRDGYKLADCYDCHKD